MRWFQFSVHDFEESYNPDNCQLITMTKMKDSCGHAWMELEEKVNILFLAKLLNPRENCFLV